jgi:uncharacterized protein YdhG (YjbR/CyaY superfamily)
MENQKSQDVDEYISRYPEEVQEKLEKLRAVIQEAAPEAGEKISYQIPTFFLEGNLVHFAAYQKHIGFYPTSSGMDEFKQELSAYKGSKGSVQFPLDRPIPYELVRKIVIFRVAQNMERAKERGK